MKVLCKHPDEIFTVATLQQLESAVEHDGHPIARYIFCPADPDAAFDFQPRIFPSNLKIKTGKKKEPTYRVELSYHTRQLKLLTCLTIIT